jgi:cytochrome c oxidase subunit 3
MTTLDINHGGDATAKRPYHETYKPASHFRSKDEEFDAVKIGMWLFLATEVLLFAGLFVGYAIFRMMHPEAFANGSHYLDWKWGCLNTVVLLFSSWTIAASIGNAQRNEQAPCAAISSSPSRAPFSSSASSSRLSTSQVVRLVPRHRSRPLHYEPSKTAVGGLLHYVEGYGGKRPGSLFDYPFAENPYEPMWWSIYYCATGIHATHVLIGVGLIGWLYLRARKLHFGPATTTPSRSSASTGTSST